jgi:hypothetical protein
MKYLCVNPQGDLEIWEEHCQPDWYEFDWGSIDVEKVGGPEQMGLEILEEWVE